MAGEEYVAKSDFWIIMGTLVGAISSGWWWLLNKIWGNQKAIGDIKQEVNKELDDRAERVARVFSQYRQDQKDDLKSILEPLRSDMRELSRRIDNLMEKRGR